MGFRKAKSMRPFFAGNKGRQIWRSAFSSRSPLVVVLPSNHRLAALKACAARGDRQLLQAVRNQNHASSRGGPCHYGNIFDNVDAWRRAATCLHTELSSRVCNESPCEGGYANCRTGPRLQEVEPVSHPKALAFEIGRVGCSYLE